MYVFIIGRNSGGDRVFLNGGLQLGIFTIGFYDLNSLNLDVGGLGD